MSKCCVKCAYASGEGSRGSDLGPSFAIKDVKMVPVSTIFFPGRDQYYWRLFFVGLLFREHPKAQPEGSFRRSPGSNLRPLVYKASDLTTAPRSPVSTTLLDTQHYKATVVLVTNVHPDLLKANRPYQGEGHVMLA